MAKPQKNERFASAANPNSETVTWDDVVPKLGLRDRQGKSTWIVQWRVDGKTRKRTLGFVAEIDRETARRLASEILGADAKDLAFFRNETIASFAERYFKEMTSWKASTLKSSRGSFERYISPTLGTKKVADLSADQVQDWLASFPCSPSTASRATAILSGMMRHAELLGLREPDSNPCQGLRKHKSSFEAHYLTKAEWARLGHALKSYETKYPKQVAVLRLLALTGARFGEVLKLKWDQIDGPRTVFYDTKSQERTIWLGKPARRLLASLPRTGDFVFEDNGAALKQGRVNTVWYKIRDAANLPKVRIHDLRHSFASVAINSGVDLRQVAGLLAHSDLKTTDGYAHLDVKTVKNASERVGRHFDKIFSKPQKKERSIYAKFTTSHLRFAEFCDAHDLDPTVFRKDLIAWRESNRGAAQ